VFQAVTLVLPRVSTLADASADLAASAPVDLGALGSELFGLAIFGLAALAFGIWRFESQDF
jgi:Cu-processing system permease protein